MNYYPVFIPTLNRYEHFKRCVDSLVRNTHADKTELIIGLDYPPSEKYVEGYKKIKEFLPTISGFKKITIFERTENYGPGRNWADLQKYAFDHYDAVIASEDDNEFSPCFLDYMDKALDYYWDDNKVVSVSGFLNKTYYGKINKPLLFSYDNNAWGLGQWKHKERPVKTDSYINVILSFAKSWKVLKTSPVIFGMLISMVSGKYVWGDVSWTVSNILDNTYQLRPSFSLVRNTGYDGSGLQCSNRRSEEYDQEISIEKVFLHDFSDVESISNSEIKKLLRKHAMPNSLLERTKFLLLLCARYIKLYTNLKRK